MSNLFRKNKCGNPAYTPSSPSECSVRKETGQGKETRRISRLILCIVCLAVAGWQLQAQTWSCGPDGSDLVTATLTDGTLTVTGTGDMADYEYSNPAPWKSYKSSITAVVIEEGVTSIGDNAFNECGSLMSVTISEGVTSIGNSAFWYCHNLMSVTIPNSVTSIENFAFIECRSLASITIPDGMTNIGGHAFEACHSLTSITIPERVTSIGNGAFNACHNLTDITVAAENTYYSSDGGVLFNENKTVLIACPAGKAGAYTIPNSVTSIEESAFYRCINLTDITITAEHASYSSDGGVLFSKDMTVLITCPAGKTGIYSIPNSVTSIRNDAFYECLNLTSVSIPNSVTSIGNQAFRVCRNLTSVTIPYGVKSIGNNAFVDCINLASVFISNSVTDIGYNAFAGCSSLMSVTCLASAPPSLGSNAFIYIPAGCTLTVPAGSKSAYVESAWNSYFSSISDGSDGTQTWECGPDGSASSVTATLTDDGTLTITGTRDMGGYNPSNIPWAGDRNSITAIVIDEGVTSIGEYAFYECLNLTDVTIPASIISIGVYAFGSCSSLTSITIPNGVKSIGGYAFGSCSNLASITIPNSVTNMGAFAFESCSSLTSFTVPAGVTSINAMVFRNCSSLTSVTCLATEPPSLGLDAFSGINAGCILTVLDGSVNAYEGSAWKDCFSSITGIPQTWNCGPDGSASVTAMLSNGTLTVSGEGAMGNFEPNLPWLNKAPEYYAPWSSYVWSITAIEIDNGVTSIGSYAFSSCFFLNSVTLPNSVESIGDGAFYQCVGLPSITIPVGVTSIGKDVFWECKLTDITVAEGNTAFSSEGGALLNKNKTVLIKYPAEKTGTYTLPASVTGIEEYALTRCPGLTGITVEDGNTAYSAEDGVLFNQDKTALVVYPAGKTDEAYIIPSGVSSIGNNAFIGNFNLKSVTIPQDVTTIDDYAFGGCHYLTSFTSLATAPPSLGSDVFVDIGIESGGCILTVPAGSKSAYSEWSSYFSSISDGSDGTQTWNCGPDGSDLVTATLTDDGTLTVSGTGAMGNFYPNTPWSDNGRSITAIVIDEGVTSIERYAFSNCANLTSVTLPNSMASIGDGAFYQCVSLTSITLPAGVTSLGGGYVLWGCMMLTDITVTDGNTAFSSDGGVLFNKSKTVLIKCPEGKSGAYTLPAGVTGIEDYALTLCSGLTDITVEEGNTAFSSDGGVLFNQDKTALVVYPTGKTDDAYVIPNSVSGIGNYAFCGSQYLTSVTIPQNVTTIDDFAFSGCPFLTSVTSLATVPPSLGSGVFTGIGIASGGCTLTVPIESKDAYGNSAWSTYFSFITGLLPTWNCGPGGSASVTATLSGSTLTVSGTGAMEDYSAATPWDSYRTQIRTVVIEEGVTLIGNVAFSGCSNLNEVTISSSVNWIGTGTFRYCTSLNSISIPGSVTAIGGDAFSNCTNLRNVEMNEGLKYINPYAFSGCRSLTSVTLPASVTSIGINAFSGCTGLTEVQNLQPEPQVINSNVFSGVTLGNLTLKVPYGTKALYEAAAVWKDFGTIDEGVCESYFQPQDGTYGIYPITGPNYYLAATADNFLVSYNSNQTPADDNATFYMEATGEVECVLAVNHEKTAQYLRGRFLFDATDLAWANGPGSAILNPGYIASGRARLAFAEGIRVGNSLYVLDGEQVSDISQLESLAQAGSIRKIDLTANSRFSFRLRLVEDYSSEFFLQTERLNETTLSYVSIYNDTPIISTSDFRDALETGTIFGLRAVSAPVPALTVTPSSLDFTAAAGSQTVDISSNVTWTVTNPASWITVSETSGSGNSPVTVTAEANSTDASRTATITVSAAGIDDRTVTVTQEAPSLTVSPSSLNFTAVAGSQTFDISSNVAWTVSTSDSWATVSDESGSGNGPVTVTVTANSTYVPRTATITVSADGIDQTDITITQEGTPEPASLTVSASSLDFATAGGTQDVNVASNKTWTAVSNAPWLTVTQSGSVLRIAATANTGYARMDSITVTADGLTEFVHVTQAAAQQIIAEPTTPANSQGTVQIALEIPVDEKFSITFTVTLPLGFVLDQQSTSLVSDLLSSYQLSITPNDRGGWLFEITPALSARSGEDVNYREVIDIVYTIQETVQKGDYDVKIQNVDLTMNSGEVIHQDEINVPVRISNDVGNAIVGVTNVRYFNNLLYVNTPVAERIAVYTLDGRMMYQSQKQSGIATFNLHSLPRGVLIVRGDSGWVKKIVR